ncbi:MAG: hypothetical protein HYR56_19125 [Acidobacteria bacterium]|nr:hypothetical protein [Acidobacteriota bacterium]MBI3426714.1 hypothetical protein [Acidobacteriota bacterium]
MDVMFSPEIEKKVMATAARQGLAPDAYVREVVQKELAAVSVPTDHDDDYDPQALMRAVAALSQRTPAQLEAAQARAIREFKPKIELPADVSPLEVLPVIRGNETDAEVWQALRELS